MQQCYLRARCCAGRSGRIPGRIFVETERNGCAIVASSLRRWRGEDSLLRRWAAESRCALFDSTSFAQPKRFPFDASFDRPRSSRQRSSIVARSSVAERACAARSRSLVELECAREVSSTAKGRRGVDPPCDEFAQSLGPSRTAREFASATSLRTAFAPPRPLSRRLLLPTDRPSPQDQLGHGELLPSAVRNRFAGNLANDVSQCWPQSVSAVLQHAPSIILRR